MVDLLSCFCFCWRRCQFPQPFFNWLFIILLLLLRSKLYSVCASGHRCTLEKMVVVVPPSPFTAAADPAPPAAGEASNYSMRSVDVSSSSISTTPTHHHHHQFQWTVIFFLFIPPLSCLFSCCCWCAHYYKLTERQTLGGGFPANWGYQFWPASSTLYFDDLLLLLSLSLAPPPSIIWPIHPSVVGRCR